MRHLGRPAAGLAVLVVALAWAGSAFAASDVVISQVYGGGGNSGATYKNDFIELYNRGSAPVSIAGWSVQYASASGTSWQRTNLSGTIYPGTYYLVQEAAGTGGTVDLPPPNAIGTIPMSATGAKVVLVAYNTTIPSGVGCPLDRVDAVGYSTGATCFEGSGPAPVLSNTTADLRKLNGAQDTDDNAADFAAGPPNPRNSDAAPFVASSNPSAGGAGVALDASITVTFNEPVLVVDPWYAISCADSGTHTATWSGGPTTFTIDPDTNFSGDEACTVTIDHLQVTDVDTVDPPDGMDEDKVWSFQTVAPAVEIAQIQGASHISPLVGRAVTTTGIVTAKRTNGFYLQDSTPDVDPATSDAVFVFTSSSPPVNVGDAVQVSARVSEFRPGGSTNANLTTTELSNPSMSVLSTGNPLPNATTIGGPGGLVPPSMVIEDDATGSVETSGIFDPAFDGIDFWESLEGMRLVFPNAVAVGPTQTAFGETPIASDDANTSVRTPRGGLLLQANDFNPERVIADDAIVGAAGLPDVNVGDHYSGPLEGVLDYNFGNFFLEVTSPVTRVDAGLQREATADQAGRQLSIATFNVENLDPGDGAAKFDRLAGLIVANLKSPDLVTLEEVQDNSGPTDDGVTNADVTLNTLVTAIQAAGGPAYQYRYIDPVNDADGGEPGGNIRIAFLYRTDRGLEFVDAPGATPTTANAVVPAPDGPHLQYSPGRIDPTNPAWTASRKPLAAEFKLRGRTFFVIGDHFNSKGGDDPIMGRFQPPTRSSETQRHQQAQVENGFVDAILAADPNANIVVLGDLNDFQFSDTVQILTDGGTVLHDLIDTLPLNERYSYEFEGNAQVLDHILVSTNVQNRQSPAFDVVHVNAEFFDQASDHDPSVVRLTLNRPPTVHAGGPYSVVEGSTITLSATGSDPDGDPLTYRWDLNGDGTFETAGQNVSFRGPDGPPSVLVSVRASDGEATATDSATVTVVVTVDSLCAFTQRVVKKAGVAAALCDKLREGAYAEYAELVDAQTGKAIAPADAALLKQLVSRL